MDRLGRNTRDVLNLVHEIDQKGASLQALEPAIDTAGAMGKMVLTVLGMVSEMELSFIKKRQAEGIAAAKARGVPPEAGDAPWSGWLGASSYESVPVLGLCRRNRKVPSRWLYHRRSARSHVAGISEMRGTRW